jgi:hypothetical protein
MTKNVRVCTASLLQSIRQDREPPCVQRARRQVSLVVGRLGEPGHELVVPGENNGREGRRRAEGVADNAP